MHHNLPCINLLLQILRMGLGMYEKKKRLGLLFLPSYPLL